MNAHTTPTENPAVAALKKALVARTNVKNELRFKYGKGYMQRV